MTGKGVFCCGENTHKNTIFQKRIHIAFRKALADFVDDDAKADSLRQLIGQIEDAEYLKEEYLSIDHTNFKFPSLRDVNLATIYSQLQQLYFNLPTKNEII